MLFSKNIAFLDNANAKRISQQQSLFLVYISESDHETVLFDVRFKEGNCSEHALVRIFLSIAEGKIDN